MVCCRDCRHFETTLQEMNDGTWERINWCELDGWFMTEDMIENGECEGYDCLDDDYSA